MALIKFTNKNKYGNPRTRVFHKASSNIGFNPKGLGNSIEVSLFKYEHTHPILPPTLLEIAGKTYLMPDWIEVIKGTTLSDIEWLKPKNDKTPNENIWEFKSSSSNKKYKVRRVLNGYKCNCMGFWRSNGNCKHVKQVIKLNEN